MSKGGRRSHYVSQRNCAARAEIYRVRGHRLGRSNACVVFAESKFDAARSRRTATQAGGSRGLGGGTMPTLREGSDRWGYIGRKLAVRTCDRQLCLRFPKPEKQRKPPVLGASIMFELTNSIGSHTRWACICEEASVIREPSVDAYRWSAVEPRIERQFL